MFSHPVPRRSSWVLEHIITNDHLNMTDIILAAAGEAWRYSHGRHRTHPNGILLWNCPQDHRRALRYKRDTPEFVTFYCPPGPEESGHTFRVALEPHSREFDVFVTERNLRVARRKI